MTNEKQAKSVNDPDQTSELPPSTESTEPRSVIKDAQPTPEDELFITIINRLIDRPKKRKTHLTHDELDAALKLAKEELIRQKAMGEEVQSLADILKGLYDQENINQHLLLHADAMLFLIDGAEDVYKELADKDTDYLTGGFNRAKLEKDMENFLNDERNTSSPFLVIMIDLDDFKKVNDDYDHITGDRALHNISQAILQTIRKNDYFYRYGGDELMVVADAPLKSGAKIADKILNAIRSTPIEIDGGDPIYVTASIGVAASTQLNRSLFKNDKDRQIKLRETLFKLADTAAYESKNNGKNQITIIDAPEITT